MKYFIPVGIAILLLTISLSGCLETQDRTEYNGKIYDVLFSEKGGSSPRLVVFLDDANTSCWFYSSGSTTNISDKGENQIPLEQFYVILKHNIGRTIRIVSEDHYIKFYEFLD